MKEGWELKRLGDICDLQNGFAFKSNDYIDFSNTMNFRMSQIRPGGGIDLENNPKYLPEEYAVKYKDYLLKEGDVVIAMTDLATETKILGVPTIVPNDNRNWLLNQRVGKLIKIDFSKVNVSFLNYVLSSVTVNEYYKSLGRGGLQINIAKQDILNAKIPLPALPEQQRIVTILDEAFAAIEKAKANAVKNLKNAKELFESYLQGVFDNNGDDWEMRKLGESDLIEIIDGDRGKNYPAQKDFLDEGHCLFMNTKNVRPTGFEFDSTMFISEAKDKVMGKGKLKRNDVVMTTRGTIGNLGVYNNDVEYDNIRINSGMLIFRPNLNKITSEYLFEILRSGIIKEQIRKQVTGAAQPQLPIKTLVNFIFPVPQSLKEQNSIVKKLNELSVETKRLGVIYQQKLTDLEELKKSILQKAFNGELNTKEICA